MLHLLRYEGRRRAERHKLLDRAETEVDDLVDLLAIHGDRQGLTEFQIAKHRPLFQIGMGHVDGEYRHGDLRPQVDRKVAFFGVIHQDRRHGQRQGLELVVDLAVDHLQDPDLVVVGHGLVLLVDIGQLIARRVDHVEIGVGHIVPALGRFGDGDIGFERRLNGGRQACDLVREAQQHGRRIGPVRLAVVYIEEFIAVLETQGLGQLVRVRVDRRVELAEELLRLEALSVVRGEMRQQAGLRRRQVEANGIIVDHVDGHAFAGDQQIVLRLGDDIGVHVQVIVPELDIRRREGIAVRPFMALAQIEGQLGEVVIP